MIMIKVEVEKKVKMNVYDKFLRKYQHKDALNAALDTNNPIIVVSLIDELYQRDAINAAINKRNSEELLPLLNFIAAYINHPRYSSSLIPLTHYVLDNYSVAFGKSKEVDFLFSKIQHKLHQEIELQKKMFLLLGSLEMLQVGNNAEN